jgi:hypothetical protein
MREHHTFVLSVVAMSNMSRVSDSSVDVSTLTDDEVILMLADAIRHIVVLDFQKFTALGGLSRAATLSLSLCRDRQRKYDKELKLRGLTALTLGFRIEEKQWNYQPSVKKLGAALKSHSDKPDFVFDRTDGTIIIGDGPFDGILRWVL